MTMIWIEGFEGFGTSNGVAPDGMEEKYDAVNRIAFTDVEAGRIAGHSWLTNTSSTPYIRTKDLGAQTEIVVGFGFMCEQLRTTGILQFVEPADLVGLRLYLTLGGEIAVYNWIALLGTTSGANIRPGKWYYIECKANISNTTGSVVIKINEEQKLSLSNKDTQRSGTAEWRKFQLLGSGVYPDNFSFDDWYVFNTSGSVNNDFVGSTRIDGILPNAAGDQTDWTPSAGANYTTVDENPATGDTDYVESSTSTDQDLYNYASVPTTLNVIHGVQINTDVRETDASDFTLKTLIKTGTTTSADSAQAIAGTSYETLYRIAEQDPDTSAAWTSSGINGAQFGIEVG